MLSHFITGLVGGLAIAAPIGPIGMLCIRRSIADGRLVGFVCGMGAATADALYGAVAGFGLKTVSHFLLKEQIWLQLFGGIVLVWIGIAAFRSQPADPDLRAGAPRQLPAAYSSTLLLTLMNPMTILSFLAIFAGLGLGASAGGVGPALVLVLGVFLGSVVWWVVVALAGGWLGRRFQEGGLRIVNYATGVIIAALGAWEVVAFAERFHWR